MVKIEVIAVGKDKDKWVADGIAHFEKLLKKYAKIKWKIVTLSKVSPALTPEEIKKLEAGKLAKHCGSGTLIALSDRGTQYDSISFATQLEKIISHSGGMLKFIIGGPYGLHQSIVDKADYVFSLSSLTFSHQVVRLVLLEQLYRAFAILNNTDYHK